jgi:hypothetical protein
MTDATAPDKRYGAPEWWKHLRPAGKRISAKTIRQRVRTKDIPAELPPK